MPTHADDQYVALALPPGGMLIVGITIVPWTALTEPCAARQSRAARHGADVATAGSVYPGPPQAVLYEILFCGLGPCTAACGRATAPAKARCSCDRGGLWLGAAAGIAAADPARRRLETKPRATMLDVGPGEQAAGGQEAKTHASTQPSPRKLLCATM
jgi:hypothetical protein